MPETEDLRVELSADIDRLKTELKKAEAALGSLDNTAESASKALGKDLTRAAGQTKKSVGNALPAVNEFSRVIQDAPFGIVGVGNNITQLVTSFGDLKRQTGSTSAALKAFAAGFIGPGGLIFLVSATVSLLTVFKDEIFGTKKEVEAFTSALSSSTGAAKSEGIALNSLVAIASNVNNSLGVRNKALEELNDKYGDYLGNLTLESLRTDAVKQSLDALNTSLLANARVRAAQGAIETVIADSLEKEIKLRKEVTESAELFQKVLSSAIQQNNSLALSAAASGGSLEDQARSIANTINALSAYEKGAQTSLSIAANAFVGAADASQEFNQKTQNQVNELAGFLKTALTDVFTAEDVIIPLKEAENAIKGQIGSLSSVFTEAGVSLSNSLRAGLVATRFDWATIISADELSEQAKAVANILENGIVNAAVTTFDNLGAAVANGENALSALGSSLLGAIGGIAVQLGSLALAAGLGIEAVKSALTSLNGGVAIAAGIGLIAIGSAFKAGARNLAGSFGGTGSAGGSVSAQNPTNPDVQFGSVLDTVRFEVRGTDLVTALNNTVSSNNRLGGTLAI